MENFTDLFGDDLSGLEGLGDFGNFPGGGGDNTSGGSGEGGGTNSSSFGFGGPSQKMYNSEYQYRNMGGPPPAPPPPPQYYPPGGYGDRPSSSSSNSAPISSTTSSTSTSSSTSSSSQQQYMRQYGNFNPENTLSPQQMGWNPYPATGGPSMGSQYRPGFRQPYPDRQHFPRPHNIPQSYPGHNYPSPQMSGRYPSPKGGRQQSGYPPYGTSSRDQPNQFPQGMQDYPRQARGTTTTQIHNRVSSQQQQQQPQGSSQQPPQQPPPHGSMYRAPFPHASPQPQNAKSSNPAAPSSSSNPMSPATSGSSSSPAPSNTPNSIHGHSSPMGAGGSSGQSSGGSSLQQLEQMVMPGTKDPSQNSSSSQTAATSPMPSKTPHSPSVRGTGTPLSPQQWQQQQRTNAQTGSKPSSNGPQSQKPQLGLSGIPSGIPQTGSPGMPMNIGNPMGGPRGMHPSMMIDRQHLGMQQHPGMYGAHPGMSGQSNQGMPMQQPGVGMMPPHSSMPRSMNPHAASHMMHSQQSYAMQQSQMSNQYQGMPPNSVSPQMPPPSHQQLAQQQGIGAGHSQQQPPQPSSQQPRVSQSQYSAGMPITPQQTSNSMAPQSVPSAQSSIGQVKSPDRKSVIQRPPSTPPETTVIGPSSALEQGEKDALSTSNPEIRDQISQPDRDTSVVTPKLCEEGEYKSDHKDDDGLSSNGDNQNDVTNSSVNINNNQTADHDNVKLSTGEAKVDESSSTAAGLSTGVSTFQDAKSESKEDAMASSPSAVNDVGGKVTKDSSDSLLSDNVSKPLNNASFNNKQTSLYGSTGHPVHHNPEVPSHSGMTGHHFGSNTGMGMPIRSESSYGVNAPPNQTQLHNAQSPHSGVMTPDSMGPCKMPHPVHIEIQHLQQQISNLYSQPQNPQITSQIQELQGRLQHLQQQMPPGTGQWGPIAGPPSHSGGPSYDSRHEEAVTVADEVSTSKKGKKGPKPKKQKIPKEPKTPKDKKPRKMKKGKSLDGSSGDNKIDEEVSTGESCVKKPKRASKKKKNSLSERSLDEYEFEDSIPRPSDIVEDDKPSQENNSSEADVVEDSTPLVSTVADKKEKKPKVKNTTPKKPKPNKTLLQFAKKKRKRTDSGSDADLDATPPPSPKKEEDSIEKRRSGRNTQRKKYVDDVDLNLSDDENILSHLPPDVAAQMKRADVRDSTDLPIVETSEANTAPTSIVASNDNFNTGAEIPDPLASGPNYAFVDTMAEDTMVVQIILASRMGSRELESDEEDDNMRLVYEDEIKPREVVVKRRGVGGPVEKAALAKAAAATLPEERKKAQEEIELKKKLDDESHRLIDEKNLDSDVITKESVAGIEVEKPKSEKKEDKTGDSKEDTFEKAKDDTNFVSIDKNMSDNHMSARLKDLNDRKPKRMIDVEEFLVKFKNFSYLHCQWLTEEELHRGDKRIIQKIRRFKIKREKSGNLLEYTEEEPFNPDYVEVDRVLDYSEHTDPQTNVTTKHYLVKWRSLPYEDCTWELETDVDTTKIKDYEKWKNPPTTDCFYRKRPRKETWKKWEASPVYKNGNQLRPYQLEGVNWLTFSWYNGRNCLLADEMGLGKTIQSLSFMDAIFNYGIRGPFLVIAPLSTIPNWQREFELWSEMNVIVYHGSQTSRNMLAEYEMYYKDENGERIPGVYKFHCLITTYECVITDILELREIKWRACCIDEAHRLKNKNCKLLEGLNLLDLETRLLLSGTPLQNNIHELYSLLSFLEPSQFNSQDAFINEFGDMQNEAQVTKLQALLKPLMLRRMKEDVEKSLKPKEETIVEVELTNMQKKYYRGILERNFSFLSKGTSNANVPNLMNTMMELRKCCIHPYLLNGAEEQIQEEYRSRGDDEIKDPEHVYFNALTRSSGKMVFLDKLLPKLKEGGHRVLIFSQMVKMLDILEDYLIRKKYPFERIDGRIRGNLRQAAIDRYCRPDSDRFIFLLCTKAGGLGINLVAADTCIIYDSDWNPQNDLQAQARCHRIGQSKMVKIYRLITRNTYEREMFDKASLKLGLDKAVLQSMNTSQGAKTTEKANTLSKKEIEDLLRKGAYGALMDDENAGDKFCEEDIEEILQRRTTTVTLENEKAGGSFSKASFTSADTADIAIDDPDFWAKWAKKAEIEEVDEKSSLMVMEPRSRKKIQRFGGHDPLDPQEVSDLDSDSDSDSDSRKGRKSGRRSKRRRGLDYDEDFMEDERDVVYGSWSKNELFRIEKSLMAFGWGRWEEILIHSSLRKGFNACAIEDAARMTLLYCLNTYKGDEKIKGFIWDLISPSDLFSEKNYKNHSGLSGPVPRGNRKNRKSKKERGDDESVSSSNPDGIGWVSDEKYDMEMFLDKSYRKHLDRNSNKILLRVRMLYYLRQEVLGDHLKQINTPGCAISDLGLHPPPCDGPPSSWWDTESDKSLLVGTHRHGYERYNMMRLDPDLCFLTRCGPPDSADIQEELKAAHSVDPDDNSKLDEEEDSLGSKTPSDRAFSNNKIEECESASGYSRFPSQVDLNGRLRRLIASYQREYKREEARQAAKDKRNEKRERIEQVIREREQQKHDSQQKKWTKKEELDFLRTLLVFGLESSSSSSSSSSSKDNQLIIWDKFKQLAKLDKKQDETLREYYTALLASSKRLLGKSITDEEETSLTLVSSDILNDDRARKVMDRIEFLRKIREEIITHPELDARLLLCDTAQDLPEWWIPGIHDKDLLLGASRHGLYRMECYILNDPELSFKDIIERHSKGQPLIDEKNMDEFNKRKMEEDETKDKSDDVKSEKEDNLEEGEVNEEDRNNSNGDEEDKDLKVEEERPRTRSATEKRKASVTISPPTISQMEQMAKGGLIYDVDMINEFMAQSYAAAIKWPKDQVLKLRLDHVVECVDKGKWPVPKGYSLGDYCDMSPMGLPPVENSPPATRDTATPLSESGISETSLDDNQGKLNRRNRSRRGPLGSTETITTSSTDVDKSKMRSLLIGTNNPEEVLTDDARNEWDNYIQSLCGDANKELKMNNSGRANIEVTSVNGDFGSDPILDLKKTSTNKGSKLESALDKIGLAKRKLSDDTKEDKTKKKKRLDDIMFGLSAAKGVNLEKDASDVAPGQSLLRKDSKGSNNSNPLNAVAAAAAAAAASGKVTDFNKLQDILGPLAGSPAETKVQKWLADQMGVVPERPITPSTATATSATLGKSPKSNSSSNPMEWMSNVSGDEHVTVFNRITGKKLSGSAGPKLKFLAQWLIDNPMFEVDPKWAEVVKSREPLPGEKRKGGKLTDSEPGAKKVASGVGPSFSTSGMAGLGLDPKNPMAALSALDPKNPMSLSALYGLDPKKMDPVTAAMLGFGDPKNPLKMDPMVMAAMGLDQKTLQSMGLDQKAMQNLGIDPKIIQSMVLDPKILQQSMGLDLKTLQTMGLDAKTLQSMGLDQKSIQALGLDPKTSTSSTSSVDPKVLTSMGLDAKTIQSMGLDPKVLQSMGLDPRMLQSMGMDPKILQQAMAADPKLLQSMGFDHKAMQSMAIDPKMLQAMGLDPKMFAGMDSKVLQSLGIDPKTMNIDSKFLQSMGLDPKSFQSINSDPKSLQNIGLDQKSLQAMGLDHKSLQAMGLDHKSLQAMGLDQKSLQSMGLDQKSLQSMGLDHKSLQSMGLDQKSLQSMGLDQKSLQSMGLDQKSLQSMGLDQKSLQNMSFDHKALQNMGIDHKTLQNMGIDQKSLQNMGLDPKSLQNMGLDPKSLQNMGLDPKSLQNMGLDPKSLQSMGLDPKSLQSMGLDPKSLQSMGLDPKSLQSMGFDPKSLQAMGIDQKSLQALGLDHKVLQSIGLDQKSLQALGLDPKTMQAMGLDPKFLQSLGIDPKLAQNINFDPKMLQMMGLDHKTIQAMGMDPKFLQAMGMDPKSLQAMGIDPKSLQAMGMDPKSLQAMGMDPKSLQAMGIDPKSLQAMGIDPKSLQAMGIDPKSLQAMGIDPKSLQAMGIDPKSLQAMGIDPKSLQAMGIDPKSLQAMGIDPKSLQAMGIDPKSLGMDPKTLKNMGFDPKMLQSAGIDSKVLQSLGLDAKTLQGISAMDPKLLQSMGIDPKMFDPKLLQSMGLDPKFAQIPGVSVNETKTSKAESHKVPRSSESSKSAGLDLTSSLGMDLKKIDPTVLTALGIDPKNPKLDPMTMAALGLDPKNPNSNLMSVLAMMDPNHLSALYGYNMMNPAFMGMSGMDSSNKGSRTPTPVSKESAKSAAASPRGSRASPSPRPPSRASVKSDADRRSPRTSAPSTSAPMSPKLSVASSSVNSPSLSAFGLDPKMLSGMDPKLLQAAGLDPKSLSTLDPKFYGMDPRLLSLGGFDPKALVSMDPKLLQAAGIDLKMLQSFDSKLMTGLDPKLLAGMDPKLLAGVDPKLLTGMDPKMLAGMDPKLFTGIDPKLLTGMDPKLLAGIDPKLLAGMDPKLISGIDPKLLSGIDPKLLQGMDPKLLSGMDSKLLSGIDPKLMSGIDSKLLSGMDPKLLSGMDPKLLAGMDPKLLFGGLDPKLLGLDPKLFGFSDAFKSMSKPISTAHSSSVSVPSLSSGSDPRLLGLDLKMLQGLDSKALQRLGLDPKLVASLLNGGNMTSSSKPLSLSPPASSSSLKANTTKSSTISTYSSLDPRMFPGFDPKLMAGLDPKVMAAYGLDPKMLASMDPKLLAGLDPKFLGMDPKLLNNFESKALNSLDPKLLGVDPKLLGLDPKSLASMDPKLLANFGIDPKILASMDPKMLADPKLLGGVDPKLLSDPKLLAGLDPKLFDPKNLAGLDPKLLDPKLLGFDPKMLLAGMDPSLAAMYGLGIPPSSVSSVSNGVPQQIPASSKLGSSSTSKPKPGTVAAALAEKKKEAAAATTSQQSSVPADSDNESLKSGQVENHTPEEEGVEDENMVENIKEAENCEDSCDKFETRKGLTSEERVLLREKKRERLMKEKDSSDSGEDSNVRKKGSKLESVLDKLADSKSDEQSSSEK